MESFNCKRPHRAIVRCKAKMQLLEMGFSAFEESDPVDDALLKDLAAALFQSNQYHALNEQCQSKEANGAEGTLVNELVKTYQQISKRRQEPIVQRLNALL